MIPESTREKILEALARFDRDLRDTPEWTGWDERPIYRYAIVHEGRRYPVEQIIALATGGKTQGFSGGAEANGYVTRRGFTVLPLHPGETPNVWWVNQGGTYRNGRDGGFLWSPLVDPRGATQSHWTRMSDVRAGDVIVHYSSGSVRALGLATGTVYAAPQPTNFDEDRPATWNERGQRLDVSYHELTRAIPLDGISGKLQALAIGDGPLNRVDGVKQGYLWRFSAEGLRVLREASDEPWPEWAEAALPAELGVASNGWDEERFFAALAAMCSPAGLAAARHLYAYAQERGAEFTWNPGPMMMVMVNLPVDGRSLPVFGLGEGAQNVGATWINFQYLVSRGIPKEALAELAAQLRPLPGVRERFSALEGANFARRPTLPLDELFSQPGTVERFEAALDAFLQRVAQMQSSSPGATPRSWIFQAVLERFDLNGALAVLPELTWRTKQHRQEIRSGDTVYLWEAGPDAGIVAIATVLTDPTERADQPDETRFNRGYAEEGTVEWGVRLRIERVLQERISRTILRERPLLKDLPILGNAQGTNFAMSDAQADALRTLIAPEHPPRIQKIAPGERAELWEVCRAEGRIRVGWEDVGDLRKYPSQDDFITAFRIHYPSSAVSTAYALWGLLDLQPGDLIIANRGQSEVLGVGEVVAPGYEWAPDHVWAQHSVRVRWQPGVAGPIARQSSWIKTIMPVSPEVWEQIRTQLGAGEPQRPPAPPQPPTPPQLVTFADLLAALRERGLSFSAELVANYILALQAKRFVILTGISGTGKTQLALAVAEAFRSRVRVTKAAAHADDALDIEVKPYMVNHKLMVLPVQFTANLLLPSLDAQTGSGQITVYYPQGEIALSIRKDPTRNVTDLFFKGEFRAWFTTQLRPGDHFLLEPMEQGNDLPHALRFTLPQIETADELLDNLLITAVRPDWTDNRGLLGYHNPLTGQYARTPFLDLLLRASADEAAAQTENRPAHPFFAILDEMNLARVEHYFADFLSALESGQPLQLHGDATIGAGEDGEDGAVPQQLAIPANLFITGTVNVDETTYMFSPKVLDRAFTIEFNHVDLRGLGVPADDSEGALTLGGFPGTLAYQGNPDAGDWDALGALGDGRWRAPILAVHELLVPENRHFGYRVANEIARFVALAAEQAGDDPATLDAALDLALLQKVLPKFHGTQQELEPVLTTLAAFAITGETPAGVTTPEVLIEAWRMGRDGHLVATDAATTAMPPAYPHTAAKLWGMLRRLRQQGFASFIE